MEYSFCQSGIPPARTVRIMFTSLVERERTNTTHGRCFKEWVVAYAVSICPSLLWRTDIRAYGHGSFDTFMAMLGNFGLGFVCCLIWGGGGGRPSYIMGAFFS